MVRCNKSSNILQVQSVCLLKSDTYSVGPVRQSCLFVNGLFVVISTFFLVCLFLFRQRRGSNYQHVWSLSQLWFPWTWYSVILTRVGCKQHEAECPEFLTTVLEWSCYWWLMYWTRHCQHWQHCSTVLKLLCEVNIVVILLFVSLLLLVSLTQSSY